MKYKKYIVTNGNLKFQGNAVEDQKDPLTDTDADFFTQCGLIQKHYYKKADGGFRIVEKLDIEMD